MPVQIGFFGAGEAARRHARALAQLDAQIVAVCDLAAPRAQEFAARFGGQVFASPTRMLAQATFDTVYICTPPGARGPVEIAAARAGIALMVEAPVALNLRTARSVLSATQKTGALCGVAAPWRYLESTERLRRQLAPKNAPKPLLWNGKWLSRAPATAWRRDLKSSGGLWLDEAYALLDLTRYLGGEITKASVFAAQLELKKAHPDATAPDAAAAILTLQSGALATLGAASVLEPGAARELSVTTRDAVHFWREARLETRRGAETSAFEGDDDAVFSLNAAWVRALQSGKRTEIRAPYADAVKTLRLALALNRASAGSKVVAL